MTQQIIEGIVTKIEGVSKKSKAGKTFKVYYATVDTQQGEVLVNVGFKSPVNESQAVTLTVEEKYKELQLVKVGGGIPTGTNDGVAVPSVPAHTTSRSYQARIFPVPKDSGEFSIIRQSALKAAIETVADWNTISDKLVDVPLNEYVDIIIKVAYTYTDFSSGHREVNAAKSILDNAK